MNSSDIARLAGVSRSTVTRVLNHYSDISEETRKKVEDVIRQYNYVPNINAQGLAGKANRIIGLFIVDIDNKSEDNLVISRSEVFSTFVGYVADIAQNLNYNILVSIINRQHQNDIQRLFYNKSICGGLVIGDTFDPKAIDSLADAGYKIVLHNQRDFSSHPNIINVNVDNVHYAYIAARELLQCGHRRIGMITGNFHKYTVQKRYQGFMQALQEYGVPFSSSCVGIGDFHRESGGYDAVVQLLNQCKEERPTALFVANSVMLPGVVQALTERNLRIPEDMSIIGVGGSASAAPLITDLIVDNQLIAAAMISKMTELLDMGSLSDNNLLLQNYHLIKRKSIRQL